MNADALRPVVLAAAAHARANGDDAHLIRLGHNAIYRLRRTVIARIARVDRLAVARKEIDVARWLASAVGCQTRPNRPDLCIKLPQVRTR